MLMTILYAIATTAGVGADLKSNGFEIPRSISHSVRDHVSGRNYQLYVQTPRGYNRDHNHTKEYPVVYLNDGPYAFQVASGVMHIPNFYEGVILVGISYAAGEKPRASRTRDLTPSFDFRWKFYSSHDSGGALQYLNFLERQLMPFVEKEYRINVSRRSLGGHSFGGLFAAWVMLTKPNLYKNYIISSPSLWFDNKMMFELEKTYATENDDLIATVYIGTGELEQMYDDLTADHITFVKQLKSRSYPGLTLQSRILEDIDHTTAFPINFTRASRWIFHTLKK